MIAPTSPLARWGRALAVGCWATLGAVAAHGTAGGQAPLLAVLPVGVATVLVTGVLAGRRLSGTVVVLLLAAPQLAVHLLAGYLHGHDAHLPPAPMLAAHLAGLALVAAGLAHGERLWWEWWAVVSLAVRVLRSAALPATAPLPVAAPARSTAAPLLDHVVVRRGPPAP
ncbi:hypothetical protein [Nocardioides sp. J54]|uniref:hypothetical protein n=1 Tax=Nocardioides sp. J54 TaxID=935866 RepID=UPI0004BBCC1F|nr:hypothetical protein [Nocardioides sp. J54]